MLFTILRRLLCRDLKMQECGTLWQVVIKQWTKEHKHQNVIKEQKIVKIDKVLRFTNWLNYIVLWVHNLNQKQLKHFNLI